MRHLVGTVLIVAFIYLVHQGETACPVNWKEYNGSCYFITAIRQRFSDEEIVCSSRNATMYVFRNQQEWDWVRSQIVYGPRIEYYIGLQRINNTWTWIDNSVTYDQNSTHWLRNRVGTRNDARHRCATMYAYKPYSGQVHQQDCYQGWGTICVKPNDAYELCNSADNWELMENKCYKLFNNKATWLEANMTCTKNQGTLLRPQTRREVMGIGDMMSCGTTDNQVWIDVSDVPYPGQFRYSDNTTIRHQFWYSYGRSILSKGGTCVFATPTGSYYWMSELCTEEKKFMCSKPTGTCPQGWAQYNNECFQLVSVPALRSTWFGAKKYCENQNTELLSIKNSDEEAFVQNMMVSQQIQLVWLGLSDTVQPDVLAWPDGTNLTGQYTHWDINFPKLTINKTDCGRLQSGRIASAWSNGYCFVSLPFVCKATITTDIKQKPTLPQTVHCDPGWTLYRGDCYYFGVSQNSSGYSWTQARHYCISANAKLTSIRDPLEQNFIMGKLLSVSSSWIGLHYTPANKKLQWVDNSDVNFLNFYPGEPDDLGKGEACMYIVGGRQDFTGAWDDSNCSLQQDFICRKPAYPGSNTSVTLPPTTLGSFSYRCGPQWIFNSLDGFCYQVILDQKYTFSDSQWACQKMGSTLASITGPREQRYLQAILNTPKYLNVASNYWIGGSDASQEGGWAWIDGSPFAYLNWHPGEPNERQYSPSGEDCIEMVPNWNYQWNDKRCDKEQHFICKKAALPMSTTVLTPTLNPIFTCGNEPMISGNYSLLDGDLALTASSSRDSTHGPFNSRLYRISNDGAYANTVGWAPRNSVQGEYIQAYFYNIITFKGIVTAGNPRSSEWVTQYKLRYQYDYFSEWVWYEEPPGTTKIFAGNTDNMSPVTNTIQFPFQAKYVRLYPVSWHNGAAVRFEIMGCVQEFCLADYAISGPLITLATGITASSALDSRHGPSFARLHPLSPQTPLSAWKPTLSDIKDSFIQVDLGSTQIIRGISIAGNPNAQEWVSRFKVVYGLKANLVTYYYQEPYQILKIFEGNVNNNETVTHYFKGHFKARFIKIEPEAFHGAIALRFDVMVCPQGCNQRALLNGNNGVNDDQLTSSPSADNNVGPAQSRLNKPAIGNTGGAWQPKYNNERQWIQVDLEAMVQITAIATQGRAGHDEWVTSYKIAYSEDGSKFYMYSAFQRTAVLFTGNFDDSTVRKHYLSLPIIARFVRIYPVNYHKKISLRWEVYGCPGPDSGTLIGCYADDKLDRDLSFEPYGDSKVGMWPPMCIHHCFTKGYYYAGLQNRYMCFCGNSYGKYGSSNSCNQACYTRPLYKCGGVTSNSVYSTGLTPVTKVCPPNWKAYNDKCYFLIFNTTSWLNARQSCHMNGGDLATVNSQAEQDLVYSIMSDKGASDVWIGLNDNKEQNFFEWINGEVTKYTNWNVNQPANTNSQNENCVMINRTDGGWQDQNCDEPHQYLCMTAKKGSTQPTMPPQYLGCDIGWVGFRWSCYLFMDQTRSFVRSNLACKARGATLVQIDDRFEQSFLSSMLSKKTIGLYWTDTTDLGKPGTYKNYDTHREVIYTNWAPNKPGTNRSCVAMQTKVPSGFWVDTPCGTLAGAVCEKLGQGKTTPKAPSTTPSSVPCPTGWVEVNRFCYQVNIQPTSHQLPYRDADKDCKQQGANLASFHNSSDFDYLWRNNLVGAKSNFWIGLNALTLVNSRRKYTWTDRTAVNYVNWAPHQPDNYLGKEDCGEIFTSSGLWNDQICGFPNNWICKISKGANIHARMTNYAPSAGPPGSCPNLLNWSSYNKHCYIVVDGSGNQAKTWREAKKWCQNYGADLVSIGTMLEQLFVQSQAANTSSATLWTGFSEIDYDFGYRWSDGSVPSYVNWNHGEPNDFAGAEDCVELMVYNGKWNDAHCGEKKGFICEAVLGPHPPTTPAPLISGYCPAEFRAHRNMCYRVFNVKKNWSDAQKACRALGRKYNLASISDIFENAFVTTLLQGTGLEPWIGLQERYDHHFQWIDNTDLTYTNWDRNEPLGNRNYLGCGRIYSANHNAGHWASDSCSIKLGYICATSKSPSITTPEAIPNPCPSGYVSYGMDCFLYVSTKSTWQAADADCKTRKTFLATIANPFEQSFLFLMINDPKVAMKTSVWIGLNDVNNTKTYQWTQTAWSVVYTNWGDGQPQRATGGGCVAANVNGHWSDSSCTQLLPYICKSTTASPPATPPGPNGQCDVNWISHGSKCYRFYFSNKLSYLDATLDCSRQKSSLASVHTMDDNNFLLNTLMSFTLQSEGFWLGLHRSPISGFEWYDKSTPQFFNWEKGEPSGKTTQRGNQENCVEVQTWNGAWNDIDCSSLRGYVCEKPQNVDVIDNTTPGPHIQTPMISPTKIPTSVPQTITPSLPHPPSSSGKVTPGRPTGTTPSAPTTAKRPVITRKPMITLPNIPDYTGAQQRQTGTKVKGKFGGLTAGGLIGVIIAVVIVLALPTIGLILWKRKNSNSSNPGSIGFENSTYQYNTKQENGQFVAEQNSTETES